MYVCICNAIKESELRDMARKCAGDAEHLYAAMGRPPQCRQCIEEADAILIDARAAANVPACVPN
jgi:bacterioferritin-associated ferredoxin